MKMCYIYINLSKACGVSYREERIVGGSVADTNAFPWLAALMYKTKFYCGATLISDRYVLTAVSFKVQVFKKFVRTSEKTMLMVWITYLTHRLTAFTESLKSKSRSCLESTTEIIRMSLILNIERLGRLSDIRDLIGLTSIMILHF
jgi:hypothetical protein